jgi:hypothetical protein
LTFFEKTGNNKFHSLFRVEGATNLRKELRTGRQSGRIILKSILRGELAIAVRACTGTKSVSHDTTAMFKYVDIQGRTSIPKAPPPAAPGV